MKNWKVEVSRTNGTDSRVYRFAHYRQALRCYMEWAYEKTDNPDISQPCGDVEVELSHGGLGYDWRIELLEDND